MHATTFLDRCISKVCNCDVMRVSCLNTRDFFQPEPQTGVYCRVLTKDDLVKVSKIRGFKVTRQFLLDFSRYGFLGVGVFVNKKLAGVSFYSSGEVVARHNRGGKLYRGIGVYLPPGSGYMFKVHILPSHRGHRLFSTMVGFAINELGVDNIRTLVTTSSWANRSKAKSLRRQGFEACAMAAELVFLGRHYFRMPLPFDPYTFKPLDEEQAVGTAIRFRSRALS